MAEKSRGTALTILALIFVLLAISDFAKPLSHNPGVGFVYLGHRLSGTANAVMGPLFGVLLLIFAYGIWTMRRYALPVAYIFTGWVIVNMVLFSKIYGNVQHTPLYMVIITTAIGIGVPLATAIILSRRQAELRLTMANRARGAALTILAILIGLMAISNFDKPFAHHQGVGFVFFGTRLSGMANTFVAPIFGIMLVVYVYGIFAMRKFALPLGIFYAAYVILNMPLFILHYHGTAVMQEHSWAYLVPYPFVAIGVSSGAAWLLYRRKADLA